MDDNERRELYDAFGGYPADEDWGQVGRLVFDAVRQYKHDTEGASLALKQGLAKQIIDPLLQRWEGML